MTPLPEGRVLSFPRKRYVVTFTDRVYVHARNDEEAIGYAEQLRAFAGADTEDIEVEEVED